MTKHLYIFLCTALLAVACTDDFDELNENPNAPEQVAPQYLLSNAISEIASQNAALAWTDANLLVQYTANIEFQPADRYDLGTNVDLWNASYRLLNDLRIMSESPGSNEAYRGVGMVLKAYLAARLTDLWGDVPYAEAASGDFTPSYSRQQDIYLAEGGVLSLLEEAAEILSNTNASIAGDILFNGNLDSWARLANSLRLRYLLRISKREAVSEAMQAIVNEGRLLQEDAALPFLSAAPNQWFIFNEREGRYTDLRMSRTIEERLNTLDDPRIEVHFKPTAASGTYKGLPNGLSRESQNEFDLSDISLLGARYRDQPDQVSGVFMQVSELQLILAEAAERNLISGDKESYYQAGIEAAFSELGLVTPEGYFSRSEVSLSQGEALEKILLQKWLAQFQTGYEPWMDYRRTGMPSLPIPKDNLNANIYPVRYRYPESEQAANPSAYANAVSQMGGDSYNEQGWWEKD